jgi:hypothetical protein
VCLGALRVQLDHAAIAGNRFVQLSRLKGNHSQEVASYDVVRADGENLPANPFGGLQPSGVLVLDRKGQQLGNQMSVTSSPGFWAKM